MEGPRVTILCTRRAAPAQWTTEDWYIWRVRIPMSVRWIYLLGDTADAEIMFARTDQTCDWRSEQLLREARDRVHRLK